MARVVSRHDEPVPCTRVPNVRVGDVGQKQDGLWGFVISGN